MLFQHVIPFSGDLMVEAAATNQERQATEI